MGQRTWSSWLGVAAVVVLVGLAGCNALVPGDVEPTPRETVTSVPIESTTPTPTATPRPTFDWLTDDGEIDTQRLFDEHTRHLSDRSFTLNWSREAVGGEGPTADSFDRRIAVETNSTFSRRDAGPDYDGVVRTYVDSSGLYRQTVREDGSNQAVMSEIVITSARTRFALLGGSIVNLMFVTDGAQMRYTERGGTEYAVLFSTTPPDYLRALYGDYAVENFSATVWVHPDRYVRTFYFEFTLVNDEERIEIGERYAYSAVGETTVEKPDWADDVAVNGTATPSQSNATATPTQSNRTATETQSNATATASPTATATSENGTETATAAG